MIHLVLQGHAEKAALEDVLRLFSESSTERPDGWDFDIPGSKAEAVMVSSLSRSLSLAEIRGQTSGSEILVESWQEGGRKYTASVEPKRARRELKRQLYLLLTEVSGLRWPWGSLTGIRPTQIAMEVLSAHEGKREAAKAELCSEWQLSPEKAETALDVGLAERTLLDTLDLHALMVYAGIPFCPGRCSYCSFISRDAGRQAEWLPRYARALVQEAETFFADCRLPVSAFYLGGGTPTALSDDDFELVLSRLLQLMPLTKEAEITVEAGRPDTINPRKLAMMKELGVQRICINPQSFRKETLEAVGRRHSPEDIRRVFGEARAMGFDHINMDLILGLPGEKAADFLYSVKECLRLDPESITLHTLALKRSARLEEEESDTWLPLRFPDEHLASAMQTAQEQLLQAGYHGYYLYRQKNVRGGLENTGFAKAGAACRYNVGMMSDEISVLGLGSGASSKKVMGRRVERCHNSKDLRDYCERVDELAARNVDFFREIQPLSE